MFFEGESLADKNDLQKVFVFLALWNEM